MGQVGPQLRQLWRARRACGAEGLRRRLGGRRPHRRWRDRAQRLRRVRRRRHLRPGARLERCARCDVVRRVRHRRAGPRHRARPHPRRTQRGGAGRRRGHHPEGLPRAQRGGALGRPGLAALPVARDDQPRLLRALRAPPDGPVRRDAGRLRRGQGEERAPRAEQPQCALPQGGLRGGRAEQCGRLRPTAPARHLCHLRRGCRRCAHVDGLRRRHGLAQPVRVRAISTVTPRFPNTVIDMPLLSTDPAGTPVPEQ